MRPPDMTVLVETLRLAVPLHIAELRGASDRQRAFWGNDAANTVAAHGDILQYGGKTPKSRKQVAATFNQLARGLACMAYSPGGVTFMGVHWCVWAHAGGADGVTGCMGGA